MKNNELRHARFRFCQLHKSLTLLKRTFSYFLIYLTLKPFWFTVYSKTQKKI